MSKKIIVCALLALSVVITVFAFQPTDPTNGNNGYPPRLSVEQIPKADPLNRSLTKTHTETHTTPPRGDSMNTKMKPMNVNTNTKPMDPSTILAPGAEAYSRDPRDIPPSICPPGTIHTGTTTRPDDTSAFPD